MIAQPVVSRRLQPIVRKRGHQLIGMENVLAARPTGVTDEMDFLGQGIDRRLPGGDRCSDLAACVKTKKNRREANRRDILDGKGRNGLPAEIQRE